MPIIIAIAALCVIILIHEIGHFAAAKIFKMNAYQFNLGMGPILWKKQHKGTQYAIRLFPIGGSVALGEDDDIEEDPNEAETVEKLMGTDIESLHDNPEYLTLSKKSQRRLDPREFKNKPVWQRIIVLAAGAFLNLVLGLVLCVIINGINPIASTKVQTFRDVVVSGFDGNGFSNTGESPLLAGDRIVGVDGISVNYSKEMYYVMNDLLTESKEREAKEIFRDDDGDYALYEFVVIRDGEKVTLPKVRFGIQFVAGDEVGENGENSDNPEKTPVCVEDLHLYAVSSTGTSPLKEDDEIIKVNGMRVFTTTEIGYKLDNSLTKSGTDGDFAVYEFVVIRDGKKVILPNVRFASEANEKGGNTYVWDFYVKREDKNPLVVLNYAVRDAVGYGRIILLTLADIANGTYGLNDISGPVGIGGVVSDVAKNSANIKDLVMSIVALSALITINLGMVNLLPIPALDGGRIVFLAIEGIRRKPLKAEVEGMIHFVGFALLMLLIVIVTFNDIRKLIFGG